MKPYKPIFSADIESEVEVTKFRRLYDSEELIDLDYVLSVGGIDFIRTIRPLFSQSSAMVLNRILACQEFGNREGIRKALRKLMGTANAAGALKIVRCIMSLQVLMDQGQKDISKEIAILLVQFRRFNQLLVSAKLMDELRARPRS